MIFQTFDDKKECIAVYANGQILKEKINLQELSRTWEYSEAISDSGVEYAKYYCGGKSLDEACPPRLEQEWESVKRYLSAIHESTKEAKLNLSDHCYFDLLPPHVLLRYGKIKNEITAHVFESYEKASDYDFRLSLTKVLTAIKNQKLNIDLKPLLSRRHEFKVRQFLKKVKAADPYICYDMDGTKTGRLTASQFPILTLHKGYRNIIKPNNHIFLEMDYNAAELRVMMALLGKQQPKEDVHVWNMNNVFEGVRTREEAKKRIFAWLYNPKSQDHILNKEYDRDAVVKKYFTQGQVTTFFSRTIEADEHHALNYIIQSTAADLFLRQMIKVAGALEGKKSTIAFCLHDSLVIDFHEEDKGLVHDLHEIFAETELGTFKVNISCGKNFGQMRECKI